jgi:hypothetical protein
MVKKHPAPKKKEGKPSVSRDDLDRALDFDLLARDPGGLAESLERDLDIYMADFSSGEE